MTDTQPAGTPAASTQHCGRTNNPHSPHTVDRGPWGRGWCPGATPEPSTPPAEPVHTAPAAAGGHPGTLDGPGVLGRALLGTVDASPHVFVQLPGGDWFNSGWGEVPRAVVERRLNGVTEVLLVDPAAWERRERMVDAARRWRVSADGVPAYARDDEERALAAAVDAYDRPTTGGDFYEDDEPAPEPAPAPDDPEFCEVTSQYGVCHRPPHEGDLHATKIGGGADPFDRDPEGWFAWDERDPERRRGYVWARVDEWARQDPAEPAPEPAVVRLAPGVHWLGEVVSDQPEPEDSHSLTDHARLPTGPAPEPAGDGPGWERRNIHSVIEAMDLAARDPDGGGAAFTVEDAAELRALLADLDRQAEVAWNLFAVAEQRVQALEKAITDLDAARAELATARRDGEARGLEYAAGRLADLEDGDTALVDRWTLHRWAAEVRSGTRPVPGSPQPAENEGDDDA